MTAVQVEFISAESILLLFAHSLLQFIPRMNEVSFLKMTLIERAETLLMLLQKRMYWQDEVFGKEEDKHL